MAFVVRIDVEQRDPIHRVFRHQADARRLYEKSASAAFVREELMTQTGDSIVVEGARLFRAPAEDPREAIEQVRRGEAELVEYQDPFELDLDELGGV